VTVTVKGEGGKSLTTLSGMSDSNGVVTFNDPPVGSHNLKLTSYSYEPVTFFCDFREGQTYDAGTLTLKKTESTKAIPGTIILPD
ncbi:MAG: hypothetical protein ACYTDT_11010, partial [Planctomycetota bacterium]